MLIQIAHNTTPEFESSKQKQPSSWFNLFRVGKQENSSLKSGICYGGRKLIWVNCSLGRDQLH